MDNKGHIIECERVHETLQIFRVLPGEILDVGTVGLAKPYKIQGDDAVIVFQMRNDVSPQIRPGGLAMDHDNDRAITAGVDVVHVRTHHVDISGFIGKIVAGYVLTGSG